MSKCPTCDGKGLVRAWTASAPPGLRGHMLMTCRVSKPYDKVCPDCHGSRVK